MPQKKLLLDEMGIDDIETLFSDIPISARRTLDFSDGMPEKEVQKLFASKASLNIPATGFANFLGGEYQSRYSPAALQYLMSRGELLTAYTSYQPEISQGMLQGLFEYQSMMAELTAMETVNASLYDGATGLGEALCLSNRGNRRNVFLLPSFIPAWKKQIANNYISGFGGKIVYYSHDEETGGANLENIRSLISSQGDKLGAAYVEMPNSLGVLDERVLELKQTLGQAHLIVGVDPISLALVKPPGEYGADIVIGEGQPLGLPLGFGGPTLGILGVNKTLVRKMPGRVVGATHDSRGNRAFCITLQTREQHIRREKATSNICSNEAHCALT
ncbi:MAG: aminomethyl-transferring glycine dehydrogenase subunit GcvPA, partial [Candidatus Thermoplasmatota archaeon]|nr:aminomethyl-transferring glycine dehydrogenase subunit GcvPA [Candidatus Thermoplasmatota archaeon]